MARFFKQINLLHLQAYLLFFLMLFVPTTYQAVKGALIVVVLASILIQAGLTRKIRIHRTVLGITVAMSFIGIFFVNLGLFNRNPGALRVLPLYVFWPLLYLLFTAGCARLEVIKGLLKVLVVSAVAICIYTLLFILHEAHALPAFLYYELDQGQNIGFYQGHVQYTLYSISSLLFLVPFLLGALVLWPNEIRPPVSRKLLWAAFILSIVPVILTERKVLWLLVLASPFLGLGLRLLLPPENRAATRKIARRAAIGMLAASVILVLLLRFAFNFDFSMLTNIAGDAFNFSSGTSEDVIVRRGQYTSMMDEWANTPWLGTGMGAAASYVRNSEMPWSYELSYVALLFHTGILGLLAYSTGIVWMYASSLAMIRSAPRLGLYLAPVLVGTTCFLIGNASNPYLEKYDYLWVIFLPVSMINFWLLERQRVSVKAVVHAPA